MQKKRKTTIRTHQSLFWVVSGIVMLACTGILSAQVLPYPYAHPTRSELEVRELVDDGLLRVALQRTRELRFSSMYAAYDNLPFDKSEIDRGAGNTPGADREMQEFLLVRPNSPHQPFAWMERGLIALEAQKWNDAVEFLGATATAADAQFAHRKDSVYVLLGHTAYFWQGTTLALTGAYKESQNAFLQAIKRSPQGEFSALSWYTIGQLYEQNAEYQKAAESFAEVRHNYANSAVAISASVREAQNYLIMRLPERALDILTGLPAGEQVSLIRAEALGLRGSYQAAYDSSIAYLNNYPKSAYAPYMHLHAAFSGLYLGKAQEAKKHLDTILALVTEEESVVRQQALLYHALAVRKMGNEEEAMDAFVALSARSGYPYQAQALVEVGQGAYTVGEYDRARKSLERAERESQDVPTTIRALTLLGAVLIEQQQWQKAAETFNRVEAMALKASETYVPNKHVYLAEARLKRGICLVQANQTRAAIVALTEFLGSHPEDTRRDEATFWLAESMYRADLLKNAQELYEEVLQQFTASQRREEAMYGLAWTFFRKRDFTRSVKIFGELIEDYPKSKYIVEALTRRGDGLYITRQFRAAADQYEQAARRGPNSEEGKYSAFQMAQAYYRGGELESAQRAARQYVQNYPNSTLADDALYLAGWIRFQKKDDAGAIEEFRKILSAYSDGDQTVRALYTIGDAQYNLGQTEEALETHRTIITRYPTSSFANEAAKSMQATYIESGRTEEALRIADDVIAANPQSNSAAEQTIVRANIFYSGKNYATAASELEAYLTKYNNSERKDEALLMLGKTYLNMNELPQALQSFQQLEKEYPKSPLVATSKFDLATYYDKSANATAADSLYNIVMERFEQDTAIASRATFERAVLARLRGDSLNAIRYFTIAADNYPGIEYGNQSRYQLAVYQKRKQQPDSARYHLLLLTKETDTPLLAANAWYEIGDLYMREKRFAEAIGPFTKVREEFAGYEDWYTLSLLGLGEALEQSKRYEEAKQTYSVVASLRPDDDYGKTAVSRLKRLEKIKR